MDRRFVGSTVALILGLLFLMTAASRGQDAVPQILSGAGAIVGALASRSLKRRRLGLCNNSIRRRVAEGTALVAIVALVLLQSNVLGRMYCEPVRNLRIPASAQLLAYVALIPEGSASRLCADTLIVGHWKNIWVALSPELWGRSIL